MLLKQFSLILKNVTNTRIIYFNFYATSNIYEFNTEVKYVVYQLAPLILQCCLSFVIKVTSMMITLSFNIC